jgi:hypothetical protein
MIRKIMLKIQAWSAYIRTVIPYLTIGSLLIATTLGEIYLARCIWKHIHMNCGRKLEG